MNREPMVTERIRAGVMQFSRGLMDSCGRNSNRSLRRLRIGPPRVLFEALEPRVMLSASVASVNKGLDESQVFPRAAMTAFLPSGKSIDDIWSGVASSARSHPAAFTSLISVQEDESNNTPAFANHVPLGFEAGEDVAVDVTGSLSFVPQDIDGGNWNLTSNADIYLSSSMPHVSIEGTGDETFDYYAFTVANAGDQGIFDIDDANFDTELFLFNDQGQLVAQNDDNDEDLSSDGLSSLIEHTFAAAGSYYIGVGQYESFASGGLAQGTPPLPGDIYTLHISIENHALGGGGSGPLAEVEPNHLGDVDVFSIDLAPGDIFGANVQGGAGELTFRDPDGSILMVSHQDVTYINPITSPLPGGGNASLSYVIDTAGTYTIAASNGAGAYTLNLGAYRPVLESQPRGSRQILFLDFDGETIDAQSAFGGLSVATLSPLTSFLSGWGLNEDDEDAVIDAIVATVQENFNDIRQRGLNGDFASDGVDGHFDIEIVTSRDSTDAFGFPLDLFGQPNVSRVIVGGTIDELGIETIGIAESIDVGNFDTQESAVVLLDLLSAPSFDPNSLNQFPIAAGSDIIDLIGVGVGNIVAHEAGHFFANWHTDQFNSVDSIMDQGGNMPGLVGVGFDGIFGTSDDIDVDFRVDTFVANEGFEGVEDTLNAIAFGLSTGTFDQGMKVVASSPAAGERVLTTPPSTFVIDLIDLYDPESIDVDDLLVNGITPDGVELTDADTLTFHYQSSPAVPGRNTMSILADAVTRQSDGDGVEAYQIEFSFDLVAMRVTNIDPAEGSLVVLPLTSLTIDVNEPFDPASVGIDDLTLSQGQVVGYTIVDQDTVTYHLDGILDEVSGLAVRMARGALTDLTGNIGEGFSVQYDLDIDVVPLPRAFSASAPPGSLIYDTDFAGRIDIADDADQFRLSVDPGQTITVVVKPDNPFLRVEAELHRIDENGGQRIASTIANTRGDIVVLQTIATHGSTVLSTDSPESYIVQVSGADDTVGGYTVSVILNAAVEEENLGGADNGEIEGAQDINASFVSLDDGIDESIDDGASRGAILGTIEGEIAQVIFQEDFEAGFLGLGPQWTTSSSLTSGRILVSDTLAGPAHGGFYHLTMDRARGGGFNLNEAILTVDLSGEDQLSLSFWQQDVNDEEHSLPSTFVGSADGDGVSISEDGITWHTLVSPFESINEGYQQYQFDLDEAAAAAGISLGSDFKIKFQQYDDLSFRSDGRTFDDIVIQRETSIADTYSFDLSAGQSVDLALTRQGTIGQLQIDLLDAAGNVVAEGLSVPSPIVNGSFETGDFTGWTTSASGIPVAPWQVSGAGAGDGFILMPTQPQDGQFVAWNGFEGFDPAEFRMYQDITIPSDAPGAQLHWQDRIQWYDFGVLLPGEESRSYAVELLDPASGERLETLFSFETGDQPDDFFGDTGWQMRSADLSAYIGSTVRLQFRELAPVAFIGPGQVELDDIRIDLRAADQPTNINDFISDYIAPADGTYFARVRGAAETDYSLIVTRDASFNLEPDDRFDIAQDITAGLADGRHQILGHINTEVEHTQTITFDELFPQPVDGLSIKNVTFDYKVDGVDSIDAYFGVFGPGQTTQTDDPSLVGFTDGVLSFEFGQVVSGFAFGFALSSVATLGDAAVVRLFDEASNEIGAYTLWATPGDFASTSGLFRYDGEIPVARAQVTFNEDAAVGFVIDNLKNTVIQPADVDIYQLTAAAGERLVIEAAIPAAPSGEFVNLLDPAIRLYDATGQVVAFDNNASTDGPDARLTYTIPQDGAGEYFVEVASADSSGAPTAGEYILSIQTQAPVTQAPGVQVVNERQTRQRSYNSRSRDSRSALKRSSLYATLFHTFENDSDLWSVFADRMGQRDYSLLL